MPIKFESLNIIPKPKEIIPKWVNIALVVSFAMFLTTICLFAFYYYQALSWQSKLMAKENDYLALDTKENQAMEKQVGEISAKLEKFSLAFSSRRISSNFFDFLRNFCHPNVSFSGLLLNIETGSVSLSGQTNAYKDLSEQIIVLNDLKNISNLLISNILLNKEGNIAFSVSFILDPTLFKIQNQ